MNWPLAFVFATCLQSVLVIQLFVEDTSRRFGLDEDWLGTLAAAETGMAALASLILFLRPALADKRTLFSAGILLFAANLSCLWVYSAEQLLIARLVMGASAGLVCSWAYRQMMSTADSAREQGMALMLQSAFLVLSFAVVPALVEHSALVEHPVYWMNGLWFAVMLIALLRADINQTDNGHTRASKIPQSTEQQGARYPRLAASAFFIAVVAMYTSHGAFDTFIAELGAQSGISLTDIGYAMMAACAIGIPAGALASGVGARLGVIIPLLLAVASMLSAIVVLYFTELMNVLDVVTFWLIVLAYNFGWVLALPFIVLAADRQNDGGRIASGLLLMQALGMASGALISGIVASGSGISAALIALVPCALLVSALGFWSVTRQQRTLNTHPA